MTIASSSAGAMIATGAAPFAPGIGAVSARQADVYAFGANILVDPAGASVVFLNFDSTGTFAAYANIRTPSLAGLSAFIQVFEITGSGLAESNGLQILFMP